MTHSIMIRSLIFSGIVLALIVSALPTYLHASPVIRSGDDIALKEDQAVNGDFYGLARTLTNSAKMSGDSYVAAWSVTQNGETTADLVAIAGTLQVHAPVGDDLRALGGHVVIADSVKGDVAVFGGELTILSTAHIEGDVMFYGGTLDISGTVDGAIIANTEKARIDAKVGKDVTVHSRAEVVLGAKADIAGAVEYESSSELVRAVDAHVAGAITRLDQQTIVEEAATRPSAAPLFILLFSGLVLRFIFGARLTALMAHMSTRFGFAALVGFASLILIPVAIMLAFVSVLGIALGVALLALYLALSALSWSLSGVFLGGLIARAATGTISYSLLWVSIGSTVLYATSFIPLIGPLAAFLVTCMVFGGIVMRFYELTK